MKAKLVTIAAEEARKNYYGETPEQAGNLHPMEQLFVAERELTHEALNTDWSGAFAYHCLRLAGIELPLHYPDPRVGESFAAVRAWELYARLPKIAIWNRGSCIEAGDLVFLKVPEGAPRLMGIILQVDGDRLEIAVGNYRNHSAIIERSIAESVRGIIKPELL